MKTLLLMLLSSLLIFAGDDPWAKVNDLNSGSDVRIYQYGSKQVLTGKFASLSEESVVVVIKNEERAIPRAEIFRIDARPSGLKARVRKETHTQQDVTAKDATRPRPQGSNPGPSTTTSSGVMFEGKADFQTIYVGALRSQH